MGKQRMAGPADKQLGQKIRTRRLMARMSQAELGEALGVTFQQVQKYEKGVNRVTVHRLSQIAVTLKESLTYFIDLPAQTSDANDMAAMMADRNCIRLVKAFVSIGDNGLKDTTLLVIERMAAATAKVGKKR